MTIHFFLSAGLMLLTSFNSQSQITPDSAQVYPNPFCQTATVEFELATHDIISLSLFNAMGQNVQTLLDSTALPSGSYAINVVGDSLPAGMYVLKLEYGDNQQKLLLVLKQCDATGFEVRAVPKITFYPNPTFNTVTVPVVGTKDIVVADLTGKICGAFHTDTQTISTSELSNGFYLIRVFVGSHLVASDKIMVSK